MHVTVEIKKVKGGFEGLSKRMQNDFKNVVAGVLKGAGSYPNGGPTIASVAEWNSKGTEGPNPIPPRPFLDETLQEKKQQYTRSLAVISRLTLSGSLGAARARRNLGIRAVRDIQAKITSFSQPPNAASTIARKGFNDPLIHTKKLLNSISWEEEDV